MTTKMTSPRRDLLDFLDPIVAGYGSRARVVVLYRQLDGSPKTWTYLGRLDPAEAQLELIGRRFGHGWYRAKILGAWNPETRREEYFEQVTFGLDEQAWPMTPETRLRIRKQHGM